MDSTRAEVVWPRARLVLGGALASALCLLALAARCEWAGRRALVFLAWNLFLAWVPLLFNFLHGAWVRAGAPRRLAGCFDLAWLVFLPNAPYLVTDLIHLAARPPVPLWFDVLFFAGFAATGCWLGLTSLEAVLARVEQSVGRGWSRATAVLVCVLCGYGVFMGRFWRLNSWDVLHRPAQLFTLAIDPLLDPLEHRGAVAFTLAFAVFFGVQLGLLTAVLTARCSARAPSSRTTGC